MTPSTVPSRHEEWRRARRAAVRAHHPDAGGDAAALAAALAEVDRRFTAADRPSPRGLRRRSRLAVRRLRSRLPRRWPGARRYIDL